jgi:hypothetical protein
MPRSPSLPPFAERLYGRVTGIVSIRAIRIVLLGALSTLALTASAIAASTTVIHFQRESLPALQAQLRHHEVLALTFHPAPAPGHVHVSMTDGRHFTVVYGGSEEAQLIALARANGARYQTATVKAKPAVHHKLRYIAGGILIAAIVVVAAVLLIDRRRKLREQEAQGPQDTPAPSAPGDRAV